LFNGYIFQEFYNFYVFDEALNPISFRPEGSSVEDFHIYMIENREPDNIYYEKMLEESVPFDQMRIEFVSTDEVIIRQSVNGNLEDRRYEYSLAPNGSLILDGDGPMDLYYQSGQDAVHWVYLTAFLNGENQGGENRWNSIFKTLDGIAPGDDEASIFDLKSDFEIETGDTIAIGYTAIRYAR
jgi:hypothetical protein